MFCKAPPMEKENISPLTTVTINKNIVYKKWLLCIMTKNSVFSLPSQNCLKILVVIYTMSFGLSCFSIFKVVWVPSSFNLLALAYCTIAQQGNILCFLLLALKRIKLLTFVEYNRLQSVWIVFKLVFQYILFARFSIWPGSLAKMKKVVPQVKNCRKWTRSVYSFLRVFLSKLNRMLVTLSIY